MDLFTKLFGDFLLLVYHCFDRIVIRGYLTALSRPELLVHFFREIVGVAEVSKEALSQRMADYQNWVEAYARNHAIPIEWAEKGVRKEDHVLRGCAAWKSAMPTVSTSSSRAWSKGRPSASACPSTRPRTCTTASSRTSAAASRITISCPRRGARTHGCAVASFLPFQTAYYLNGHSFIEQELKRAGIGFRKHDNAFLAVDDVAALEAAADRLSPEIIRRRLDHWTLILGPRFSKKERARLNLSRSTPSPRSSTAATSSSGVTFPSTSYSSAAANSACGGSALTRSPRSSASGSVAGCMASWPR